MAVITQYTYSIATDFVVGKGVYIPTLTTSIQGDPSIYHALDGIDVIGDVVNVFFKDAIDAVEKVALDNLIAAHDGTKIEAPDLVQLTGTNKVQDEPPTGTEIRWIMHNLCDRTTWYGEATRHTGMTATDSGDGLTFNLQHGPIIDTYHGKLHEEDNLVDSGGFGYRAAVYVDGIQKVENDPDTDVGDYTVNYALSPATITFGVSQAGKSVTADYHAVNGSRFTVKPTAGKKLIISGMEAEWSDDMNMLSTFAYGVWAPLGPGGTFIPLAPEKKYKTRSNFTQDATGSLPEIKPSTHANAASNWRMNKRAAVPMRWPFLGRVELLSSLGMELRLHLIGDTPWEGETASALLKTLSEDENP